MRKDATGGTDGDAWRGRTVLVTGCSGFIGGFVVESLLSQGARVLAVMRDPRKDCYLTRTGLVQGVAIVATDLREKRDLHAAVAKHQVEVVVHLAGLAILAQSNNAEAYAINTLTTLNLLDALQQQAHGAVFVLASSDMVYGPGGNVPFQEGMQPKPHNAYAASKFESEQLAQRYARRHHMAVGIARLSNVYGAGDLNFARLVPGTARAILAGQRPKLRSDGQSLRDFVHVDDVVRGLLKLAGGLVAGRLRGEVLNLAAGQSVRVVDVVMGLLKAAGREDLVPELGPPDSSADAQRRIAIQKAREQLEWTPHTNLDQGLARSISWYKNSRSGEHRD